MVSYIFLPITAASASSFPCVLHGESNRSNTTYNYFSANRRNTGCKTELFLKKDKDFFEGGEVAVAEDKNKRSMEQDDFTEWEDASDQPIADEALEKALAAERALELVSELEQDENPRDYTQELEDEEEEAAPTSEKR